jgi:hypothetical protein
MNFKKTMFALAVGSVGMMGAMSAHAVAVNNGDTLSIDTGAKVFTTIPGVGTFLTGFTGSWFGMDNDGSGTFEVSEKTALSAINSPGVVIGATSTAGPYGAEALAGSAGPIVDSWAFFSASGTNFTTVGITGSTETGLDLSGWSVAWNNVPFIDMGAAGTATFNWDGVYGSTYTLDYTTNVPASSPAFPGVGYSLHLEGTVAAVPEASTYGMMLAGLGLVGFAVRRRKLMA